MKPTKICFVTREYAHKHMGKTGGIGVFIKHFCTELKQHGFEITVFTFGTKAIAFNDEGIKVIRIKDLRVINEWIKAPLRRYKIPGYISIKLILEFINRLYISLYLSFFAYKKGFDLIEFHDYGGDAPYFIGKPPKVVRCHGSALTLHQHMGYVNRISDSIFEKHFFKRFQTNIIAVSHYSAQITQQTFGLKSLPTVIYNGVRLPHMDLKPTYIDSPTQPYALFYFGTVRERKGIVVACEVFNTIIKQFPEATFHVLGNNNLDFWNTNCVKLLSKTALKSTRYYGPVPNSQIADYLCKAHVVLFPSYGENFSIALLEVMALGKIAITSNIAAFKEIIVHNKNGLIAESFDDYVHLINAVFKGHMNLAAMSEQARATIAERFEATTIIKENIQYYKSLL